MSVKRAVIRPFSLGVVPGLVFIVAMLYVAKAVLVPLVLAILLTILLSPIVRLIQHVTLRRVPAVLVTVALAFALLGTIGWAAGTQLNNLARELPQQKEKIRAKINDLRGSGDTVIGRVIGMVRELSQEPEPVSAGANESPAPPKPLIVASPDETSSLSRLSNSVLPFLTPLITVGLVLILVIFMLVEREDLRDRLIALLGQGKMATPTRMIDDATTRLSRYLVTQSAINLGFGVLLSSGLLLIGVPYAFLWGFLAAILRFVPYVGTWIAGLFPLILSFALSPDWTQPLIVLGFYAVLELGTGNVIEPYMFGHRIGVTPITLLVAAVFWTWLWGPIGLILSTPLTVCLIVIAQNVPRLKFLTILMSDQAALTTHIRYYQRLLAKDQEEAKQLVDEQVKSYGVENVCDHLLLPALLMARQDHRDSDLSSEEERHVIHETQELLKYIEAGTATNPVETAVVEKKVAGPIRRVLILGGSSLEAIEELSLKMLGVIMKDENCRLDVFSVKLSLDDIGALMEKDKPALILIPTLPPRNTPLLCKLIRQLRSRFPALPIIVGSWGELHASARRVVRLRSAGATSVTVTLRQTREHIHRLVDSLESK